MACMSFDIQCYIVIKIMIIFLPFDMGSLTGEQVIVPKQEATTPTIVTSQEGGGYKPVQTTTTTVTRLNEGM